MKVATTPKEMMEKGVWDRWCELTGTSPYAVNEGLMPSDERVEVEMAQAVGIGLVRLEK